MYRWNSFSRNIQNLNTSLATKYESINFTLDWVDVDVGVLVTRDIVVVDVDVVDVDVVVWKDVLVVVDVIPPIFFMGITNSLYWFFNSFNSL